ncbi:MAG: exosortase family protein XrtF [Bacteroidetes bacterium MedPE-SWsnd-G2]|nr:MAG: exosortase family protein XrtF [Bacteroidetes bacterium MedPE-SWsnd-G2]
MKQLLSKYKSVVKFILTFFIVYGVLTLAYKGYLSYSNGKEPFPDFFTNTVAHQSVSVLNALGFHSEAIVHTEEPSLKLLVDGNYVARVVEGCNSISVIILFVAFIVAFSGRFKSTFLYICFGIIIIYISNILRISLLTISIYKYPGYIYFVHDIVFPLVIYGVVFLLWVYWVNKLGNQELTDDKK